MKKAAVLLSGCGYLDGTEIRESVLTLLELENNGFEYKMFAPNFDQFHVVNHKTAEEEEKAQARNILNESARIARGNIQPLEDLQHSNFDCLVIPGGFGVAKNFCTIAFDGENAKVNEKIEQIINSFLELKKPIGAICIAPALIAKIFQKKDIKVKLTLGSANPLLNKMGAEEVICKATEISYDSIYKVVCTPAYMTEESLPNIHRGVAKLIKKLHELV